jgi:hypothetical protein
MKKKLAWLRVRINCGKRDCGKEYEKGSYDFNFI